MSLPLRQRATTMVVNSLVSDAATMPLHWIYNQADLASKAAEGNARVIFHSPPSCPYYSYTFGALSPYGDEVIPFLRSIAQEGSFSSEAAAEASYNYFKAYSGRLNHVAKEFVKNRDEGKAWADCSFEDNQAQGIIKMPLAVARYAGSPELIPRVREMVRVLQKSPESEDASSVLAVILERALLTGESAQASIRWAAASPEVSARLPDSVALTGLRFVANDQLVSKWVHFTRAIAQVPALTSEPFKRLGLQGKIIPNLIRHGGDVSSSLPALLDGLDEDSRALIEQARDLLPSVPAGDNSILETVMALGMSCALPGAFLSSLFIVLHTTSLEDALTQNILAGGDNCSRSLVVAGLFSAGSGPAAADDCASSEGLLANLTSELRDEIVRLAGQVVAANPNI